MFSKKLNKLIKKLTGIFNFYILKTLKCNIKFIIYVKRKSCISPRVKYFNFNKIINIIIIHC